MLLADDNVIEPSFLVTAATHVPAKTNVPRSTCVTRQIAILYRSLPFVMDPDSLVPVAIYPAPLNKGIASCSALHSRVGIAEDVAVL